MFRLLLTRMLSQHMDYSAQDSPAQFAQPFHVFHVPINENAWLLYVLWRDVYDVRAPVAMIVACRAFAALAFYYCLYLPCCGCPSCVILVSLSRLGCVY